MDIIEETISYIQQLHARLASRMLDRDTRLTLDHIQEAERGAQLVGVSMEDVEALQKSNEGRSSVELLSDDGGAVSKALGAELNIPLLGKFSARQTFLLSPEGEVVAKWKEGKNMSNVKTPEHAREVLAAIDAAGLAK